MLGISIAFGVGLVLGYLDIGGLAAKIKAKLHRV